MLLKTLARYASLVRFSHTIFAMPFALVGFVYALCTTDNDFTFELLIQILLAMVTARNTAMGFNRYADRKVVLLGYSYTKRFTAWCHIVLGVALGIAPVGAYIAVTGQFAVFPILLAGLVITWCSGFDIIYALQDVEFDRQQALHSVPVRFGVRGGIAISILLHLFSLWSVIVVGLSYGAGVGYWIGALFFIGMLVIQHGLTTPHRLDRIGPMFGVVNGLSSVGYALCAITDLWFHYHTFLPG